MNVKISVNYILFSVLYVLFMLNAKNRKNEDHGDDGEEHSGDGADGEVEPEDFLGAVGEERDEAEDGGDYG